MRKYASLCVQTVYILTLSQNWKLSKSENNKKDPSYICSFGQSKDWFFVSSGCRVEILFQLTLSNPSLQEIIDNGCKHWVNKILPVVSVHAQREIELPRIRVYIPLCVRKNIALHKKDFLITPQAITFFSINPTFTLVYRAILQWLKLYSKAENE